MVYKRSMNLTNISLPIHYLFPDDIKPDEYGLVAVGGDLSALTLLEAYSRGIFPWAGDDPIPWYSPDPRLVLYPGDFKVTSSFCKILKKKNYKVHFDRDFLNVITNCSSIERKDQAGTWIDTNIIQSYQELFDLNIAHCIEVYTLDNKLMGGLYGLSLGTSFFGESMFSVLPNGSKIALYHLCEKLISLGFGMIDCQQSTPHMRSLGGVEISRKEFLEKLTDSLKVGINIINF